jgi:hypothetical protein
MKALLDFLDRVVRTDHRVEPANAAKANRGEYLAPSNIVNKNGHLRACGYGNTSLMVAFSFVAHVPKVLKMPEMKIILDSRN